MPPRNRSFFVTPIQSDRTSYGYGHTELQPLAQPVQHWATRFQTPLAMLVVFVAAILSVSL